MTFLSDIFNRTPPRKMRASKTIQCWLPHGETTYRATVEQHGGTGVTPEEAISNALASYLEHC